MTAGSCNNFCSVLYCICTVAVTSHTVLIHIPLPVLRTKKYLATFHTNSQYDTEKSKKGEIGPCIRSSQQFTKHTLK